MALISAGKTVGKVGVQNRKALLAQLNDSGLYLVKRILSEIAENLINELKDARKFAQSNVFWRGQLPKNPQFGPGSYVGGAPVRKVYTRTGLMKSAAHILVGLKFGTNKHEYSTKESNNINALRSIKSDIEKVQDEEIFRQVKYTTRGAPFKFEYYLRSNVESGHPRTREPYGEIQAVGFQHRYASYKTPGTDWLGLAIELKVNKNIGNI